MIRFRELPLVGLFLLLACGGEGSSAIPGLVLEEWEARPLSTEARFLAVRDMFTAEGSLWVLDAGPPFLTRISLETGDVTRFGGRGPGPGEFVEPWAIQPASDTSGVLVWDFGSYRVSEFSSDGTLIGSELFPREGRSLIRPDLHEVSYVDPYRVRRTEEGFFSVRFRQRINRTSDFRLGTLALSDRTLLQHGEAVMLGEFVLPTVESLKEWAEVPFWDVCDGKLVVWNPASQEILWFGHEVRPYRQTAFALPTRPTETKDIEIYLGQMARLELGSSSRAVEEYPLQALVRRARDRFSSQHPTVTGLRCQDSDLVWARRFSTRDDPLGKGAGWIAAGPEGPMRNIEVPPGFSPFLFSPEGAMGSLILPGGMQAIARAGPRTGPLDKPHKGNNQ